MTIQNIAFSSNFPKIMQNKTQKEVSFSGDPGTGLGSGNISDIELDEYATKVLKSGEDIEKRKKALEHLRNLLRQQKEEENTTKKLDTQG